ncbi:hypothetical protein QQS21_011253 [Conoideocrella luteorostrata]|uniref:Thioredoxin n=1 Tax=Conoideocrella luteorostrata TaxID=1105319 RepID=A0AAJ0FNQ7_9HYPO|nr:hypothetical protein QQS21_011253 [Conoideocrella luteorostrata]
MDVHLLVYDLSRGLARQLSAGILGFQLDAIYHTSIQLNGREYVYDGGIIAITPGTSHLGEPLEKQHLGTTNLPMDIIEEYLDSIRPIFTLEAYDLFRHNCNNFSDSFANFLVGSGIPSHIVNMPQAVLDSPMGRMLFSQLTQGVNAGRSNGSILGLEQSAQAPAPANVGSTQSVKRVSRSDELSRLLDGAKQSCAIIFFTSATCPPCKMMYPTFDKLAEEFGKQVTFIKIDIDQPSTVDISQSFSIRATPTFVTMLKGTEENRWSGADQAALRGNVQLLAQMAHQSHPHERLRLPSFANSNVKPVLYSKVPPLAKLDVKMGDEVANCAQVKKLKEFLKAKSNFGAQDAVLPHLGELSSYMQETVSSLGTEILFAVVDLFRCALADPRVSAYFAEESKCVTVKTILNFVNDQDACPYALRLVTVQMACNMFSSPLFEHEVLRNLDVRAALVRLVSTSFLDDAHNNVRVASSSLLFNIALANRQARAKDPKSSIPEEDEVELAAALVEAISQEEKSTEALQGMLSALGHLVFGTSLDGELADLLRVLDAQGTIASKKTQFPNEKLISEVADELLGKGLRKP